MSGGSAEYVSACYKLRITRLTSNTDQSFINKYIDVYDKYDISKYGDAIYETSSSSNETNSWFNNSSGFIQTTVRSLLIRGGRSNGEAFSSIDYASGLFSLNPNTNEGESFACFRPVCVVY